MKILNLYSCLGGNRYKWNEIDNNIQVTAIENDPILAELYQQRFKNDLVIVTDAHEYLLNNYKEFNFIWSSPPCPSHSKINHSQKNTINFKPAYPDLKLYEEVIFLQHHFNGLYLVENVIPYYEPLIPGTKRGRHLYWSNFFIPYNIDRKDGTGIIGSKNEIEKLCKFHDYDFRKYKGVQRIDKIARNLVDYEAGRQIFKAAKDVIENKSQKQMNIFENNLLDNQ